MEFQSNGNSRRSSAGRRISGGIVDRVAQFEHLALKSPRPITPINQNSTEYYPPTPMDTPCGREIKHESMNPRFADNYDTSMEETIKPRSSQRAKGIFAEMRRAAERAIPSPPQNTQMPSNNAFDSAPIPTSNLMSMSNLNMDFMKQEQSSGPQYSPESSNLSCHSSPEFANMELFGNSFTNKPNPEHCMSYPDPPGHGSHVISSPASHRRSESVSSMNIEETVTDTGITIDDIATYISGPDPNDGKWDCMYPDCKKRFGRKENIKSHVQTHLGDRQYQCSHCKKCFVRQHDLKRHAKIHSGVKPYPCQCGNSFARHDALTRHRQRGMCVGAFEGIVKKLVKRGRPRKNRPNDEERLTKSSKTRNKHKALSSTSLSGGSDSTSGQSPRSELDDILDDKPFGDYEYTQASTIVDRYHYSQAQSPVHIDSQCVSPQMTQTQSPSAFSNHSVYNSYCASVTSDHLPSHPASPTKSFHSYHSPPGLCDSSSSPAPSIHYYDLEVSSPHNLANISEHDDEMFLEAFSTAPGNDSMTTLERDPGLLLRKLEDEFINGSDYESGGFFSN
ncbi:hypothetical protein BJ878DRAFT_417549 [Calycina marina]|uniref:C2H2-type domain-containing protein n=1 Tax=Calycina marina TaxID=1763456 RepID=A0A9P8CGX7_9HELO|nr:hypothetical protein BJ878DRAFT_417549 [Calycina marina]